MSAALIKSHSGSEKTHAAFVSHAHLSSGLFVCSCFIMGARMCVREKDEMNVIKVFFPRFN